jgi:hypothetical protein
MKRKLVYWGTGLLAATAIGLPAAVLLQRWMNSQTNGSVQNGPGVSSSQLASTPQPQSLQTPYFITSLPASFAIKQRHETPDSNGVQLSLLAVTSSQIDQQFAISVGPMPHGGIGNLGDYNLRTTQTSTYAVYALPDLPAGAAAFRTITGPAAFTVFWPHGNQYIELALSSDAGASYQPLESTLQQIITNWQWR